MNSLRSLLVTKDIGVLVRLASDSWLDRVAVELSLSGKLRIEVVVLLGRVLSKSKSRFVGVADASRWLFVVEEHLLLTNKFN